MKQQSRAYKPKHYGTKTQNNVTRTNDLIPLTLSGRSHHSMAFQTPTASTVIYKDSFFPQNIRDCNALQESVISSAEIANDCISKFTSLVRGKD